MSKLSKKLQKLANIKKNKLNKEYWTSNPMTYVDFKKNIDERIPKNKNDFDKINFIISNKNPDFSNIISSIKKDIKNKIVLDIGCGYGSSSIALSKYAKQVIAIDLTKPAILGAKKNLKYNKITNVRVLQKDAEKMKFKKNSFDFIFSWGVIHHSFDPKKIFKNIFKFLKPKGSCFIMVYNFYSIRYFLLTNYHLFFKLNFLKGHTYKTIGRKFTDGYYHKHYKKKELKRILSIIGFKNINLYSGHYKGRILPFMKSHENWFSRFLSRKFGYFLYAKFTK